MRSAIVAVILGFWAVPGWSQLGLDVEGNGVISGNLTVSSPGVTVLNLRAASDPLIEIRNNNNDYLAFLQVFGNDMYVANRLPGRMLFRTSNLNQMVIDANGNVGIGTGAPASKLTIIGPENNGTIAGLEILSGSQKLLMDGNEIDSSVGLHFNFNSQNDVLFRTAIRRAEITMVHANGNGTSNGVAIEHPGTNNVYWTLYSTNGDGALELYHKGSFRGEFNAATGNYTSVSDGRLKQGIRPLEGILERVARLNPSSYSFRSDPTSSTTLGFIAQEVEPLFPELVSKGKIGDSQEEIYTLDSSGFGVIAIAAIQEMLDLQNAENARLRAENEAMQQQITGLAQRLDQLENR
jgi:hypothetical protein